MDVDDFGGRQGMLALNRICTEMARAGDLPGLAALLKVRANGTYEKHEVPRIVAAALASTGVAGIGTLSELLPIAPGAIYPAAILRCLWLAASGQEVLESGLFADGFYPTCPLPDGTREAALTVLNDFIIEAQADSSLYNLLLDLQQEGLRFSRNRSTDLPAFARHVMEVTRESSISLTTKLIEKYDELVDQAGPERAYQDLLEANPVLIDPLAAKVHHRPSFGGELVPDFVIRRHDARYVVVEIEKPQDPIFTRSGDFSRQFNHAVRQVLDFQGWVSSNVAYARRNFPLIESPAGLVVIGRRSDLSPELEDRLRRWCANSRHLDVLTFDDISTRARALAGSLRPFSPTGVDGGAQVIV